MNSPPFQTCNIDELIQVAPYAGVYVFPVSLHMFVTTLHWTSLCSVKTILSVAVSMTGLTVLERHQTQSRIARAIGYVSHDALPRLAEQLPPLFEQVGIGLLLLIEALTPGYLILDAVCGSSLCRPRCVCPAIPRGVYGIRDGTTCPGHARHACRTPPHQVSLHECPHPDESGLCVSLSQSVDH